MRIEAVRKDIIYVTLRDTVFGHDGKKLSFTPEEAFQLHEALGRQLGLIEFEKIKAAGTTAWPPQSV